MTRDEIIKTAEYFDARGFVSVLEGRGIQFSILDQDNIAWPNRGYLNLIVDGMDPGEALLFFDGVFQGL
jgi:hypothetical protein